MKVQAVSFTSNSTAGKNQPTQEFVSKDTSYSRKQYKTECLTNSFISGSLTAYTLINIFSTKNALKKIDELPKDEIIKNVNKSFKKNIKWGLLAGVLATVAGHFWFDFTEPWCRKLIAKSESYDAESSAYWAQANAQKELNVAIKAGDKEAQKAAIEKYNAAEEDIIAIKTARKGEKPVQKEQPKETNDKQEVVETEMAAKDA